MYGNFFPVSFLFWDFWANRDGLPLLNWLKICHTGCSQKQIIMKIKKKCGLVPLKTKEFSLYFDKETPNIAYQIKLIVAFANSSLNSSNCSSTSYSLVGLYRQWDGKWQKTKKWLLRLKMLLATNMECLIALFGSLKAKKNSSSSLLTKNKKQKRQWASLWIYKGAQQAGGRRKFSRWNSTSDEGRGNLSINMTKALSLMSYSKQ